MDEQNVHVESISVMPTWEQALTMSIHLVTAGDVQGQLAGQKLILKAGRLLDLVNSKGSPEMMSELRDILTHAGELE